MWHTHIYYPCVSQLEIWVSRFLLYPANFFWSSFSPWEYTWRERGLLLPFFCICLSTAHTRMQEKSSLYPYLGCNHEVGESRESYGLGFSRTFLPLLTIAPVAMSSLADQGPARQETFSHTVSKAYKPSFGFVLKWPNVSLHLHFLTQRNHFIIQFL